MYTLEKKFKFGVFGCCISRDAFNRNFVPNYKEFFEISLYTGRISLICLMEDPVFIDENLLKILPENPNNINKTREIIYDISRSLLKDLLDINIDYLIIDNYLEVLFGVLCWEGNIISYPSYMEETEFKKRLKNFTHLKMENQPEEYFKLWTKGCDLFFKYLNENLPDLKIILHKARPINRFLKEDGTAYVDTSYSKHVETYSPLMDKLDKYIEENFEVSVIEFDKTNTFLDENHRWGKSPVHYTSEFYLNFFDDLQKIIFTDLISERERNNEHISKIYEKNKELNYINNEYQLLIMENKNKNGRTLIYSCVDKEYAHWIPIYCLGMLYHNSDIDIEIGMEGKLCDKDHQAIEYLKTKYPNSTIKINENLFVRDGDYALINIDGNEIKCLFNTVRFITTPTIINEFIYIGDIDIICLEKDIFSKHVEFMNKEGMCYSNMMRKNTNPPRLTGLHFSIYNQYYPLPSFEGIDMKKNDEAILTDLVTKKGITLNYSTTFRPDHGIHFSKNRPSITGNHEIPGWNPDSYKEQWDEFTKSEEYLYIISKSNKYICELIDRINKYFFPERFSPAKPIFIDNKNANWHHQTKYHTFENGIHTLNNTDGVLQGAIPHLSEGSGLSSDFNLPICFEFDIMNINTDNFQIQIYPDSNNVVNISKFVKNDSHVTVKVYFNGLELFIDNEKIPSHIKTFPSELTDKCRIGLQLKIGTISFSNFIVRPL